MLSYFELAMKGGGIEKALANSKSEEAAAAVVKVFIISF